MPRDIDQRDPSYIARAEDHIDAVREAAAAVGGADHPTITVNRLNPATGSPAVIHCAGGPAASAGRLGVAAHAHLFAMRKALGFGDDDVFEFAADPAVQRTSGGTSVVHLRQLFHGIPVHQMQRTMIFDRTLHLVRVKGDNAVVPPDLTLTPEIDAVTAVALAGASLAEPATGAGDEPRRRVELPADWTPTLTATLALPSRPAVVDADPCPVPTTAHLVVFHARPEMRLAWQVELLTPDGDDGYTFIVDAEDGRSLLRQQRAHAAARGRVFIHDPSTRRRRVEFPRRGEDYRLPLPSDRDFPLVWCDDDATEGDNVRAHLDAGRLRTVRGRAIDGTVDFSTRRPLGDDQLVINSFYWCNYLHDFFELLGFDSQAGNFQVGSRTASGERGHPVHVIVKREETFGGASMSSFFNPPTLRLGRDPETGRHTALDFTVVAHEYTHAVANRIAGGVSDGSGLLQPQSKALGEGTADFFALSILNEGRRHRPEVTAVGAWLRDSPAGLRRHRYDDGYPDGFGDIAADDVRDDPHHVGEVWCAAMMTFTRRMERDLGDRDLAYRTVWAILLDGLKLGKSNPSFLDARDSLEDALDFLLDAESLTPRQHALAMRALWETFAHYGMGKRAVSHDAFLDAATIRANAALPPLPPIPRR